ncbi:MAG TPA: response regulator [Candidatus Pelethocola excrementipullorum]|nr:response regulator [Candidatus Pelethocola excrementipullorum]
MYQLVIIDDEKKILDGIAEIFPWNNLGFEVKERFTRAKEALDYIAREQVDVVLTDICMPDMSGLELAKELKVYEDLQIVVFSSYSDYKYMREALQLNIGDYLLKPINYNDLLTCFEKVKSILDEKNSVTEENEVMGYYESIINRVDEYVENNFQNANLSSVAEIVGISSSYLSKIYKENKGIGFSEYLNKVRMEKAGSMLMSSDYKNYEIAYHVGYDSPKNFTRAFKAYYQVTPREYRNGIRPGDEKKC